MMVLQPHHHRIPSSLPPRWRTRRLPSSHIPRRCSAERAAEPRPAPTPRNHPKVPYPCPPAAASSSSSASLPPGQSIALLPFISTAGRDGDRSLCTDWNLEKCIEHITNGEPTQTIACKLFSLRIGTCVLARKNEGTLWSSFGVSSVQSTASFTRDTLHRANFSQWAIIQAQVLLLGLMQPIQYIT